MKNRTTIFTALRCCRFGLKHKQRQLSTQQSVLRRCFLTQPATLTQRLVLGASCDTTGYNNTANGCLRAPQQHKRYPTRPSALTRSMQHHRQLQHSQRLSGALNNTGNNNTAIGIGRSISTPPALNTANGCDALFSNTTGIYNTATGVDALLSNTTGNTTRPTVLSAP